MHSFKKAVLTVAAAGALALGGATAASAAVPAHAGGAGAQGVAAGSPGVLSGNLVQVPISIPVNVCGNSISLIGLLNPTFGNSCSNG